ncbi:MAG: Spy/CpxP family protein refolding chaperone [Adhaeribacter sp.]
MRKNFFKLLMLFWLSGTCVALQAQDKHQQDREEHFKKIRNYKITYLTSKLDLSPEQAQKFWPVYNQYDAERNKMHYKTRISRPEKLAAMSEQDLREKLLTRLEVQQNMLDLDKTYMDRFLKVISARQLAILYRAEDEFPRVLLEKLRAEKQKDRSQPQ